VKVDIYAYVEDKAQDWLVASLASQVQVLVVAAAILFRAVTAQMVLVVRY
jgi:hypothetical protein